MIDDDDDDEGFFPDDLPGRWNDEIGFDQERPWEAMNIMMYFLQLCLSRSSLQTRISKIQKDGCDFNRVISARYLLFIFAFLEVHIETDIYMMMMY